MSKRKIKIFPGDRLPKQEMEVLLNRVLQILDFKQEELGRLLDADISIFNKKIDEVLTYYLIYQHPIHEYMNKGFLTLGNDLRIFLAERINPERWEGIDIWIMPMKLNWLIGCNHDGNIYYKNIEE